MKRFKCLVLLLTLSLLYCCSTKAPTPIVKPMPEISCICLDPVELVSSEPVLEEDVKLKIEEIATNALDNSISEILPPDMEFNLLSEETDIDECEMILKSRIVFLKLVEKDDTIKSAAQTAAGIGLMVVTGIGFYTVPTGEMSINISLLDGPDGKVIWQTTEQSKIASASLKEDYPVQATKLVTQTMPHITEKFPYQKQDEQ
jgi:hypothetical protein